MPAPQPAKVGRAQVPERSSGCQAALDAERYLRDVAPPA
jgi:hypothetical protein